MNRIVIWIALVFCVLSAAACGDDNPAAPVNQSPAIRAQHDTTAAVGSTLELWAVGSDADADGLTYGLIVFLTPDEIRAGLFPDTDFSGVTGRFRFRPGTDDRPERRFSFTVVDGHGGSDSTFFAVAVP